MSEFNEANWKTALTKVFEKSIRDPEYRALCQSDPVAAIKQVSDIDLPPKAKIQFAGTREDYIYAFLLPPVPDAQAGADSQVDQMIEWATVCTDFTTTFTWPA